MPETFDFAEALSRLRSGERLTRAHWMNDAVAIRSLVFVPGRTIRASFAPMIKHLGDGTEFQTADHIDAIYEYHGGDLPHCVVGYQFLQDDVLATDWMVHP